MHEARPTRSERYNVVLVASQAVVFCDPSAHGCKRHLIHRDTFRAEFNKITIRTALGFVVMGFIGFFVSYTRFPPDDAQQSCIAGVAADHARIPCLRR